MWELTHGNTTVMEEAYKLRRQALPSWFKNKPTMDTRLMFYWYAYWDLSSCRQESGMPIPWIALDSYAKRWGIIHNSEFDSFCTIIRTMESGYFTFREDKDRAGKLLK